MLRDLNATHCAKLINQSDPFFGYQPIRTLLCLIPDSFNTRVDY